MTTKGIRAGSWLVEVEHLGVHEACEMPANRGSTVAVVAMATVNESRTNRG
jgi:hypothetical protein